MAAASLGMPDEKLLELDVAVIQQIGTEATVRFSVWSVVLK